MTATYSLTSINVQGDDQEVYEVYADESKGQTIAFCFTEEQAQMIASAQIANVEVLTMNNIITIASRICPESHRYATDLEDCPACTEITQLRQDKAELVVAAEWALGHLQTLDVHRNHPGIVSRSLNSHGLKLWDKHEATLAKVGKGV